MKDPIIITGMPRSGSSLMANIFAEHGVQTGKTEEGDSRNPNGYYQNELVEDLHKTMFSPRVHKGDPVDTMRDNNFKNLIYESLKEDIDFEKPWLVKFSAMYIKPWAFHFPNSTIVCARRQLPQIIESGKESGLFNVNESSKTVMNHLDLMQLYCQYCVWFEGVINYEFSDLEKVFEDIDELEFDSNKASRVINPEYRNF